MEYPSQPPLSPPPAKSNTRTIIIIVVVVLLLCCCCTVAGAGYWLWNNGDQLLRDLDISSHVGHVAAGIRVARPG